MRNTGKTIVIMVFFLELCGIAVLANTVIRKLRTKNVLGEAIAVPLDRSTLNFPGNSRYAYFYELDTGTGATESASWLPYVVHHEYTNDSLNERFEYSVRKPDTTYRIVSLGDSFTFGMFVDTKYNYSERLEDALNTRLTCGNGKSFEVINLGVPGYDVAYSGERYRRRGAKYDPDLVLWYLRDDDFFIINELFYPRIEHFKQELAKDGAWDRFHKAIDNPYSPVSLAYDEIYKANSLFNSESRRKFTADERMALRESLMSFTSPAVVFTFSDTPAEYKEYMKEAAAGLATVTYFDDVSGVETFHPYDYHPTENGHKVIADALFDRVRSLPSFPRECTLKE